MDFVINARQKCMEILKDLRYDKYIKKVLAIVAPNFDFSTYKNVLSYTDDEDNKSIEFDVSSMDKTDTEDSNSPMRCKGIDEYSDSLSSSHIFSGSESDEKPKKIKVSKSNKKK